MKSRIRLVATFTYDSFFFQYIAAGSDDFNIYVWEIPREPIEKGEDLLVETKMAEKVVDTNYSLHCFYL